jgi:excisionase family DNA binding protein
MGQQPASVSIQEAARLLGVSDDTIRRMIKSGQLPAFKVRSQWRIRKEEVERIMRGEREK